MNTIFHEIIIGEISLTLNNISNSLSIIDEIPIVHENSELPQKN